MRKDRHVKTHLSRVLAGVVTLALATGFLVGLVGGVAQAATPGWEPDANSVGFLTFYDASGHVVTGGSLSSTPVAAYFVGSATPALGGTPTKAQILFYTPTASTPDTWGSCDVLTGSTNYPVSTAPAPVGGTTLPVASGVSTDLSLAAVTSVCPNTLTDAGHQNMYQLRLFVSGAGVGTSTTYDSADILVNPTAGTWSVTFPTPVATTTTVTANPASGTQTSPASNVTLTANVTAGTGASGSATGTVRFYLGTTQLGTAVSITLSGTTTNSIATFTTTTPPAQGLTAYSARFDPTPGTGPYTRAAAAPQFGPYVDSTGTLSYSVNGPADNTSTALVVTQDGTAGHVVTFTATVTDSTNAATTINSGTVTFVDVTGANGTHSYGPSSVSSTGVATFNLPVGFAYADSHSVTAGYSGVSGTFNASTSAPVTFSQTASACTTCTDIQSITATVPSGTLTISTPYTSTAPLNLGTMALTTDGSEFQATAQFGSTSVAAQAIYVTDTRAGALPWTVNAVASSLTDGTGHANGVINGQNAGLTNLATVLVSGNGFNAGATNFTMFANPAANPAVAPGDTGILGLGNALHQVAHAAVGTGAVGITGLLTLNAPTSTETGVYTGTITFTIVGA